MWPSLPTANSIADIANSFFIGSLVVGVVSTILIVWMAGVKESYWEKDRTESAERIAALGVQGDQLRKDTAEATARAAEAQLALEKFKAPRRLSPEQITHVREAVSKFPDTPFDLAVNPSPEAQALAVQMSDLLESAGWKWLPHGKISGLALSRPGKPGMNIETSFTGLAIEAEAKRAPSWRGPVVALMDGLTESGLPPLLNMPNDGTATDTAIHIIVGAKP
jgi:hypothetical protein